MNNTNHRKPKQFRGALYGFLVLFILILTGFRSFSQIPSSSPFNGVVPAVMNTAGGSYHNPLSYYRFEWSFGEMLLTSAMATADSSYLVTHGVLQPCTETLPAAPPQTFGPGDYKLFPNPNGGIFEINFFIQASGTMRIQLINALGQTLETRQFTYDGCCRIEHFDIRHYPDGVYLVIPELSLENVQLNGSTVVRRSGIKVVKQTPK